MSIDCSCLHLRLFMDKLGVLGVDMCVMPVFSRHAQVNSWYMEPAPEYSRKLIYLLFKSVDIQIRYRLLMTPLFQHLLKKYLWREILLEFVHSLWASKKFYNYFFKLTLVCSVLKYIDIIKINSCINNAQYFFLELLGFWKNE